MQMIFLQMFENDRGCLNYDRGSPLVKFSTGAIPLAYFFTGMEADGALGLDVMFGDLIFFLLSHVLK